MKLWTEKAGDHSANLRIVGTFKTEADAQKAVDRINSLLDITKNADEPKPGDYYAKEILDFMVKKNVSFSPQAVASCAVHSPVEKHGKSITVETEALDIQVFIEAFIACGGKIEVYSLHDYK